MITIEAEVRIVCDTCGDELKGDFYMKKVRVEPCETCIKRAEDAAREEGYDAGYDKASEA
jgi:hypothetical protein